VNCEVCGTELPHGALFCGECGRAVGMRAATALHPDSGMPVEPTPDDDSVPTTGAAASAVPAPQPGDTAIIQPVERELLPELESELPVPEELDDVVLDDVVPDDPVLDDPVLDDPDRNEIVPDEVEQDLPPEVVAEEQAEELAVVQTEEQAVVQAEERAVQQAEEQAEPRSDWPPQQQSSQSQREDDELRAAFAAAELPRRRPATADPSLTGRPDPFPWGDRGSAIFSDSDELEQTLIVPRRETGERFVLQFSTGESITVFGSGLLGRNPMPQPTEYFDQLVSITDPGKSVSKTHLEFGQEGGAFWVSDRFSGNGSAVREPESSPRRLVAGKRYRIVRGTRVDIGEQFFVVS
jgi:hypothetical protein